jgi:Tfp pilus assembly protein PilE
MTILLALLRRYWLHIAVVGVLAFVAWRGYAAVYERGARDERSKWLAKENAALAVALSQLQNANVQRDKAQARADALGKHPPKVIERIHEYPSGCVRPAPVADAVRMQIDDTNKAIRDMR